MLPYILTFNFKARKWLVFATLFDGPARVNPLEFLDETYPAKTRGWGYRMVKFHSPHLTYFD